MSVRYPVSATHQAWLGKKVNTKKVNCLITKGLSVGLMVDTVSCLFILFKSVIAPGRIYKVNIISQHFYTFFRVY